MRRKSLPPNVSTALLDAVAARKLLAEFEEWCHARGSKSPGQWLAAMAADVDAGQMLFVDFLTKVQMALGITNPEIRTIMGARTAREHTALNAWMCNTTFPPPAAKLAAVRRVYAHVEALARVDLVAKRPAWGTLNRS